LPMSWKKIQEAIGFGVEDIKQEILLAIYKASRFFKPEKRKVHKLCHLRCSQSALYSICYGMELRHVKGTTALRLKKAGLDTHIATDFVNHPLMKALFEAREEALRSIAKAGGARTCFAKWCAVSETRHPRQIMAEVAQALELKLILPAFRLAAETREFTIVLFQHDGFTLHFLRRGEMWLGRIATVIQEEVAQHGCRYYARMVTWNGWAGIFVKIENRPPFGAYLLC
jgi:hypothetical protein